MASHTATKLMWFHWANRTSPDVAVSIAANMDLTKRMTWVVSGERTAAPGGPQKRHGSSLSDCAPTLNAPARSSTFRRPTGPTTH